MFEYKGEYTDPKYVKKSKLSIGKFIFITGFLMICLVVISIVISESNTLDETKFIKHNCKPTTLKVINYSGSVSDVFDCNLSK